MPVTRSRRDEPLAPIPNTAAIVAPAAAEVGVRFCVHATGLNPRRDVMLRVTDESGNFGLVPAGSLPLPDGSIGPIDWIEWDAGDLTLDLCQRVGINDRAVWAVADTATVTVT